VRYQGLEIL